MSLPYPALLPAPFPILECNLKLEAQEEKEHPQRVLSRENGNSWPKYFAFAVEASLRVSLVLQFRSCMLRTDLNWWNCNFGSFKYMENSNDGFKTWLKIGWGDNRVKSKITLTTPLNMFLWPKLSLEIQKKIIGGGKCPTTPPEDFGPPRPPPVPQVAKNGCWSYNLGYFSACKFFI